MPTIQVKNLSKTYESYRKKAGLTGSFFSLLKREKLKVEAVKNISFEIAEGELVGFLGPNGAGKTTTLKILAGILYPTAGEVKVLGYTPWDRKPNYQKQFSIVMGQKNQLWWDLPAQETFLLNKEIYEITDEQYRKTLDELTKVLDIKDVLNIQVRKLSLGQRMKCELIAALLHKPKILFLDEPTIGLDVVSRQNIHDFIKKYNQQEKTTIILTSHYMEDVEALCQRVIIINLGKIVYDGYLTDLVKKYTTDKLIKITFKKPISAESLQRFGRLTASTDLSASLRVSKEKCSQIASQILTSLPVDDINISEIEIEEIIRRIFQEKV